MQIMKQVTYFPLYNYYFKYLGFFLSIAGLMLVLLSNIKFETIIYFGLLIIAFSKEKYETEHTINTRNDVFKSVFGYCISLVISLNLVGIISSSFQFELSSSIYVGLPLVLYLTVFYLSLIFKVNLCSSIELTQNVVNNKKLYTIWFFAIFVIASVLLIIRLMK